jgi:glycogen debranching enzyme
LDYFRLEPDFSRNVEITVPIQQAGAFAFYTTYTPLPDFSVEKHSEPKQTKSEVFYIDVAPNVKINGQQVPLNALSCFSIISKFMGKYPNDWISLLRGVQKRGYNMVHFTPLMERGDSNSPYSLFDQLKFDSTSFPNGEKDVAELVKIMEKDLGLLSLTDVVWNHTANNSPWLQEHPEAGYNALTAPWLESALELDTALLKFSKNLKNLGYPTAVNSVRDLLQIMDGVKTHVLGTIRLWEFYVVDVESDAEAASTAWTKNEVAFPAKQDAFGANQWSLKRKADYLLQNALIGSEQMGERFRRKIDPKIAAGLMQLIYGKYEGESGSGPDEAAITNAMVQILDEINLPLYKEYDADNSEILEQIFNRVKYVRLDEHGPRLGDINEKNPLIESYFTRLPSNATTKKHDKKSLALVNNGWVWNGDAMKDNAGPASRAYLRREVIVWSDCVKLRYGKSPEDNPYLWNRMTEYTQLMAKYFSGFRIDNCHSTPLVVAEYLLDKARETRPNLVVYAELFTGSEETDYLFVERLGLSALIREAMQAWSTAELSRLVHRHGGDPIGSFDVDGAKLDTASTVNGSGVPKEEIHHVKESPINALFMDCTHDNEVPAQKRDARDTLPNAALVSMCASASGSVMGYDEIYPKLIDLVGEKRLYSSPYSNDSEIPKTGSGGIGGVKAVLNQIHVEMGKNGFSEMHVHHENEYITVHRVHPETRKGYFLIAHTAFPGYSDSRGAFNPVTLTGTKASLIGAWQLKVDNSDGTREKTLSDSVIKGLPSEMIALENIGLEDKGDATVINVPDIFPPGSIALFSTSIPGAKQDTTSLDSFVISGARQAFADVNLSDLNFILYRCDSEERDLSGGQDGVYDIPGHGKLVYAGLQGWWSVLSNVITHNDLGHPLCQHLREGKWPLVYIVERMEKKAESEQFARLAKPTKWLKEKFAALEQLPNFLVPRYFALVVEAAYRAAAARGVQLMSKDIQNGSEFLQSLALVSIQQTGVMNSTSLYPKKQVPCLAAGLPHFSVEYMRCWGRDVFISLRGLLLGTGRFEDAKEHILAFASVMKHGLIPNLLDGGRNPRYNARDAVWFFLQAVQDYSRIAPNGIEILKTKVARRFLPYDDTWFPVEDSRAFSESSTIEEVVQEALQQHATGQSFREANAGTNLDMQMKPEGFQIDISVDWKTGIIFGGSQYNCGTWMDKMGESDKAGNKGVPGTPRDGAAVEITGMLYSTLVWVEALNKSGKFSWEGVTVKGKSIRYSDWASRIETSFEKCYYVPTDPKDDASYDVNPKVINRRGVYKDLYRSGKEYEDYQLRPNFAIAMCVAPKLFDPEKALQAISLADKVLRGPTGMATLDPSDLNYRPNYYNSEDSGDFATSKGRNYHQGPEWLWPTGFFLRALLKFDWQRKTTAAEKLEVFQQVNRRLAGCKEAIKSTPWAGLTELTNQNGAFCADSVSGALYFRIIC